VLAGTSRPQHVHIVTVGGDYAITNLDISLGVWSHEHVDDILITRAAAIPTPVN
jgi:hypothetical protein